MADAVTSNNALPLSCKAQRTQEQPISYLMQAVADNPALINLAAGLVDDATLPVDAARQITNALLESDARGRAALQYDTTRGLAGLRQAVLGHLEALESRSATSMSLSADDVLVTTGSQQALYLIADVLVDPGDIVITSNPSYFVFSAVLTSVGAKVMAVPMDDDGMRTDALEGLLSRLEAEGRLDRVKFIYCTSYFQNPTGLTLSLQRRRQMLEIARRFSRRHRLLIVEDAAYRELCYDGEALPSIKSFDPDNQYTVLTQTFSKPFAPGIKTGYSFMPRDLLDAVARQKGNHDFGSANLCQHIALQAMSDGSYMQQVQRLRDGYRRKRDIMLAALDRHMPRVDGLHWTRPRGGLYIWMTLPASIDTSRGSAMFESCLAHGVLYVPGAYCFHPDEQGHIPTNHLRLSFGQVDAEKIEPGIERLAAVVREQLQ